MNLSEMYVGMRIKARAEDTLDHGTIVAINNGIVQVDWDIDTHEWMTLCKQTSTFNCWVPLETKQEHINNRIKSLWNRSNWVKKNPQYAY